MAIVQRTGTANTTWLANRSIEWLVIHYTAGVTSRAGTAASTADWFANPAAKASADFIVDDDIVIQLNPDIRNRYCWAVGGNKYNNQGGRLYGTAKNANCISIEICSTNDTGKVTTANDNHWYFTDIVLERAADLAKYLMEIYNIDADHVIRHYDVNGKPCPGVIGWNADSGSDVKWNAFHASLTAHTIAVEPYQAIVVADALNVRNGPGTGYPINTTMKNGEIGTIVAEQDGWGNLRSGAGWVSLAYVERYIPAPEPVPAPTPEPEPVAEIQWHEENEEDDEMITLDQFKSLMAEYRAELQDNDAGDYSQEARDWAVQTGIIAGGEGADFNGMWQDTLTREQMVTVLYRLAKQFGVV